MVGRTISGRQDLTKSFPGSYKSGAYCEVRITFTSENECTYSIQYNGKYYNGNPIDNSYHVDYWTYTYTETQITCYYKDNKKEAGVLTKSGSGWKPNFFTEVLY